VASSSIQGLVLDLFAPLSHKRTLRGGPEDNDGCPSWIRPDDWRRLNAYQLRAAYTENVARFYLSPDGARNDYREYGDAALLVSQAMAALLGREQTIAVDGAENFEANRGDGEASPADQGGTAGAAPGPTPPPPPPPHPGAPPSTGSSGSAGGPTRNGYQRR
jgi:hypothetical protein